MTPHSLTIPDSLPDTFEWAATNLGTMSPAGDWLRVNQRLSATCGLPREALVGRNFRHILDPREPIKLPVLADLQAETAFEAKCRRGDGSHFWANITLNPALAPSGRPNIILASIQDIQALKTATDMLTAERHLMVQQLRMQSALFNATQEGMLIIAPDDLAVSCNPAFTIITDYTAAELRGRNIEFLFLTQNGFTGWQAIKASLDRAGHWAGETWNRRKNGEVYLGWTVVHALTDDTGRMLNYVLTSVDITRMPHAQTELARLAFSDPLTGLPNRTLLMNRLSHALSRARRFSSTGAVMFIDLDGFKSVNDHYGHPAGDELLRQTAERLKTRLREVDTVARFGGDEFVALLEDISKPANAENVAGDIIRTLATSYELDHGVSVTISGSVGVAMFDDNSADPTTIIAGADRALYAAKQAGRSCYRLAEAVA
jgi:diguanylate cyclase (GGDEF)-like protein/PAS domain S-box-containing protein